MGSKRRDDCSGMNERNRSHPEGGLLAPKVGMTTTAFNSIHSSLFLLASFQRMAYILPMMGCRGVIPAIDMLASLVDSAAQPPR